MAKKFFKATALFLTLVIAAGLFSGCDGLGKPGATGVGSEVKLNGDKIYPVECDDTLSYWFTATEVWSQRYEDFGETPLGKALEEQTGVKIEYMHPGDGQGVEQFQIMLASDDLPDIVNNSWYTFPGGPEAALEQEYIYELTDIFEKYAPGLTALLKENEDWDKSIKTDAGKYYAFPTIVDKDKTLKVTYGPIIRSDWLQELGISLPTNIDEWEEMLTAFKDKKGAEAPFMGDMKALATIFYPAYGGWANWYQDGGEIKFGAAQPQYKDYLAKMNDWYNKGLIFKDFVTGTNEKDAYILNGKSGAFAGYAGSGLGGYMQAATAEGFDLTGAQFPVMKNGDVNAEYSDITQEILTSNSTAISKNCKNVELAARFLDYGFTEEGHNLYNFGIEGETYNWVDRNGEKYPEYSELVTANPEGLSVSDVLHAHTRSAHVNVPMVQDVRYIQQYYSLPQQQASQAEWAKTNMMDHLIPPIYIVGEENDKDSDIMAAVQTYVDEMTIKFITGRESLDKFDEYLKQLDEFGLQTSVEFRQKALKRYESR